MTILRDGHGLDTVGDWLPEDERVFVVLDVVATLDLDAFVAHSGPTVMSERRSTRR